MMESGQKKNRVRLTQNKSNQIKCKWYFLLSLYFPPNGTLHMLDKLSFVYPADNPKKDEMRILDSTASHYLS